MNLGEKTAGEPTIFNELSGGCHAYDGLPDEACGLLAGPPGTDRATAFYPCRNTAESSRVYTVSLPFFSAT